MEYPKTIEHKIDIFVSEDKNYFPQITPVLLYTKSELDGLLAELCRRYNEHDAMQARIERLEKALAEVDRLAKGGQTCAVREVARKTLEEPCTN